MFLRGFAGALEQIKGEKRNRKCAFTNKLKRDHLTRRELVKEQLYPRAWVANTLRL